MTARNLQSYSKEDLSEVLRLLKSYKTGLKQVWNRAEITDIKYPKNKVLRVEYANGVSDDFLQNFSKNAVEKFFPNAKFDSIEYIKNSKIQGGIRLFYGDDLVDLSFWNAVRSFQ